MRLLFSLSFILLFTVSCNDNQSAKKTPPEGTIAMGKFRVTGNAASGPYALKLANFSRFIADEFSEISAWTLVESERKIELLTEKGEGKIEVKVETQPNQTGQLIENSILALEKKLFGKDEPSEIEPSKAPPIITQEYVDGYPAADYIMVGQMDGFDFDINRQTNLVKNQTGQDVAATLNSRSYIAQSSISLRLIKVENREIIFAKRIMFHDKISSSANMETQVNEVLKRIASRLVAEILLSFSGDIQVAAINQDGSLLLNRGLQHGLKKDMTLDLKRPGDWVKDPETGENLTRSSHKIGSITLLSVTDNTAIAQYNGKETIQVKDLAFFDNSQLKKQDKGFQPIRMAIGTVKFSDTSPKAPDKFHRHSLGQEIEQGLAQQLNGKLGIKIVDQESQRIKDMLAQQLLTDLNQGKEPGLPLGTLRGVDYLVFMAIVRSELTSPKKQKVYLDVLEQTVDQIKSGKGYIKAHVFLQDVNTAETAARTEIKIHKKFSKDITAEQAWSELIEKLLVKVNKSIFTQLRPLQILSTANNSILLNHGKDVLKIGDKLTVYGKGETVIDPFTGERIEHVGSTLIAQLSVSNFLPSGYALAELSSGSIPQVGMTVSIEEKKDCKNDQDCEPTNSNQSEMATPNKPEVIQYNW